MTASPAAAVIRLHRHQRQRAPRSPPATLPLRRRSACMRKQAAARRGRISSSSSAAPGRPHRPWNRMPQSQKGASQPTRSSALSSSASSSRRPSRGAPAMKEGARAATKQPKSPRAILRAFDQQPAERREPERSEAKGEEQQQQQEQTTGRNGGKGLG